MHKPLMSLTAADLMSRNLVLVPQEMSLQGAARLLSRAQVSGAPVVDGSGRCVGVLSTTDFLHWAENGTPKNKPREVNEAVCHSWHIFGTDASPTDSVSRYMTANPVVMVLSATISEVAQMMTGARIHRVIIVDHRGRPIGLVSSTDILAAVAREARPPGTGHASPIGYEVPMPG